VKHLPPVFAKLKYFNGKFDENEIKTILDESYPNRAKEVEFETFLRVSLLMIYNKLAISGLVHVVNCVYYMICDRPF